MEQQARSDLYGSAELIESVGHDISRAFTDANCQGVPLGHNPGNRRRGLVYDLGSGGAPGHALTFGATRSGKGVNTIIPALLTYSGSVVVIDPKGENAWITGKYRETFSRVVVLDPWNEVNDRYGSQVGERITVTKFNPLSALDPASKDFNDDVVAIADALTVRSEDLNSHWTESAKELIAGLIAAAVEDKPGRASLRDVRQLITADDDTLVGAIEQIQKENPNSLGTRKLRRFIPKKRYGKDGQERPLEISNEISSIRSTAETQTAVLDSEMLLDALETDVPPFDLSEIGTGSVSLYLVLPVDKLVTHGRWLRLILTLAIRIISRQRKPPALPVLFVLDEMGTIGNLSMVEQSFGLMAGLGIRIWGFLQDLSQLKRDYPRSWETFWSNSSIVQVLNCGDLTTSDHVSKYLGTMTVNAKTGGKSLKTKPYKDGDSFEERARDLAARILMNFGSVKAIEKYNPQQARQVIDQIREGTYKPSSGIYGLLGGGMNQTEKNAKRKTAALAWDQSVQALKEQGYSEQGVTEWSDDEQLASRPVLYADEVRESDRESSLILMPGIGNFRVKRFTYYSDPVLSGRARHDPNKPPPVIADEPALSTPASPPQEPTSLPTIPPAANRNVPPGTMGEQLADMGKDAARKAANAAGDWLSRKLNGK